MRNTFNLNKLLLVDKEELRTDKAVEVPRKEPYDLIAELLELTPMFSTQEEEQEISRKKKPPYNIAPPIESNTMVRKNNYHVRNNNAHTLIFKDRSMAELLPALAEPEQPYLMKPEQHLLLATQFRQHVQLMAQHFAMTFMHPEYHYLSKICKQNLIGLRYDKDKCLKKLYLSHKEL